MSPIVCFVQLYTTKNTNFTFKVLVILFALSLSSLIAIASSPASSAKLINLKTLFQMMNCSCHSFTFQFVNFFLPKETKSLEIF